MTPSLLKANRWHFVCPSRGRLLVPSGFPVNNIILTSAGLGLSTYVLHLCLNSSQILTRAIVRGGIFTIAWARGRLNERINDFCWTRSRSCGTRFGHVPVRSFDCAYPVKPNLPIAEIEPTWIISHFRVNRVKMCPMTICQSLKINETKLGDSVPDHI